MSEATGEGNSNGSQLYSLVFTWYGDPVGKKETYCKAAVLDGRDRKREKEEGNT